MGHGYKVAAGTAPLPPGALQIYAAGAWVHPDFKDHTEVPYGGIDMCLLKLKELAMTINQLAPVGEFGILGSERLPHPTRSSCTQLATYIAVSSAARNAKLGFSPSDRHIYMHPLHGGIGNDLIRARSW